MVGEGVFWEQQSRAVSFFDGIYDVVSACVRDIVNAPKPKLRAQESS